jgi:hypothetical protein
MAIIHPRKELNLNSVLNPSFSLRKRYVTCTMLRSKLKKLGVLSFYHGTNVGAGSSMPLTKPLARPVIF